MCGGGVVNFISAMNWLRELVVTLIEEYDEPATISN